MAPRGHQVTEDGSLPMWLPRPEYDGMLAHDADLPRAAGLSTRPVAETDTVPRARRAAADAASLLRRAVRGK